ncbi:hydroxyethylthiazole kinase [Breoghania sp. L-A4]|uniref:hydroxyethylthiazole kinase n=1 Tax=Breoghania sp. L-A4 TaxID=2304600 RepID=UPI001967B9AC|nr:hydroxyethylthiazole kinase [Breoghania sp. L-A4]
MTPVVDMDHLADSLERLRGAKVRVHCITNAVAQNFSANMLLALGVRPSMTVAPSEVPAFVSSADALLVNLGTLDRERRDAIDLALDAALETQTPWVLDPVLVNRSPERLALARALVDREPMIVRANAEEFASLAEPGETAAHYAVRKLTCVALTGEVDRISDGGRSAALSNGHPLMARVTAMGCAATAVASAFLAVEHDPLRSAVCAFTVVGVAGEIAAGEARGPGSFAVSLLDALYTLDGDTLRRAARVAVEEADGDPRATDLGVTAQ